MDINLILILSLLFIAAILINSIIHEIRDNPFRDHWF